jgi:branched-chain amino acid aminotransferase
LPHWPRRLEAGAAAIAKPARLGEADEVFLTGSAAEVTPVGEVGNYRFTPGAICRLMWEDFDRTVGKQVATAA